MGEVLMERTESLFSDSVDSPARAPLGVSHLGLWDYAQSYRAAAEQLFGAMLTPQKTAEIVLPFLYVWRHHFELVLKCLAEGIAEFEAPDPGHPIHHRLTKMLDSVPSYENASGRELEMQNEATAFLKEFDAVDPHSFVFRYPTAKDKTHNLTRLPPYFDAAAFHRRAIAVSDHLCEWFGRMDHALERVRMQRHYPPISAHEFEAAFAKASTIDEQVAILDNAHIRASYWAYCLPDPEKLAAACFAEAKREHAPNVRELLEKIAEIAHRELSYRT